MHRCSIVIPVFNQSALTRQCLDALLAQPMQTVAVEIVVVDDASSDDTREALSSYGSRIRVVTHEVNRGFASSCNDGAAAGAGEFVIFLNNDTLPQAGWLDALAGYVSDRPRVAMVASKLLFPDDTVQHAGVVVCEDRQPRHIYTGFPADHPAVNKSRRFQIVTAACVLVRRSVFEAVGGFDAAFVNGYEDVDLCLRVGEQGHEVHYCHESVLYHFESSSRRKATTTNDPAPSVPRTPNVEIFAQRWGDRLQPDELRYYIEDGLLAINYRKVYPYHFVISPMLGAVALGDRELEADRLLERRADQVWRLLRQNMILRASVARATPPNEP
jgi:GT2 family glycosyltransferase